MPGLLSIVLFLMWHLTQELAIRERNQLFGTAFVIFAFRAVPTTGAGETWWMIDVLDFDQQFLSQLSLISSALTLFGMFLFRRFMAERPITYIVAVLTVALTVLYLAEYCPVLWCSRMDPGAYRRCRGRPLYCAGRYGAGIAVGTDRHDSDAGLDCQFSARTAQGDLFCGDGCFRKSGPVAFTALDQGAQSVVCNHTGSQGRIRHGNGVSRLQRTGRAIDHRHVAWVWPCRCWLFLLPSVPFWLAVDRDEKW